MTRRLVAGAAVGTGLILGLAACGGSGKSADAGPNGTTLTAYQVLQKTSQKTGQVNTFSADVTLSTSGSHGSAGAHATADVRLRPDVALTGTLDKATFGGFTLNSSIPVVLLNNTAYAKVPSQFSQFSQFTGGKPWVKVDLSKAASDRGQDATSILGEVADVVDPGTLTKTFTASKDAAKVGSETIDGTNTTHYKGTVTVKEALATLDAATQKKLQPLYQKAGDKAVAFELWADGSGYARKVVVKPSGPNGESATLTVVYSSFGKSVNVSAPAASDVGTANVPGLGGK